MSKNVLVLGGAGFVGSNIAEQFVFNKFNVTVIDGLLPFTGGDSNNLRNVIGKIKFIKSKIDRVSNLQEILSDSDIIIDAMAWTSHLNALDDPLYDLELNCASHLNVIMKLKGLKNKKIIYLGSRGQYGNPNVDAILESTTMHPEDIQGVHKLSGESYYRIYSRYFGFDVISLRLPNIFGKNQPVDGNDIGLVGQFIVKALRNEEIIVYGSNRSRSLMFVNDVVDTILQLTQYQWNGFIAYNIKGYEILITSLAENIISIANSGHIVYKTIPSEIRDMDSGSARYNDVALRKIVNVKITEIDIAISETIKYFKRRLR